MAGSETVNRASLDSGPSFKNGLLSLATAGNNIGLKNIQGCVDMLGKKSEPIEGGATISRDIPWTDLEHTRALKPIFEGTSLCGFIFCIS
jgi:hypothetical protein